jgi:hypothetical protein
MSTSVLDSAHSKAQREELILKAGLQYRLYNGV